MELPPSPVCEKEEEEKTKTGIISPPSLPPSRLLYCCCSISQQQQQQLQQLLFSDWIREGGKKGARTITSRRHPWSCNLAYGDLLQMPFFDCVLPLAWCSVVATYHKSEAEKSRGKEKSNFVFCSCRVCSLWTIKPYTFAVLKFDQNRPLELPARFFFDWWPPPMSLMLLPTKKLGSNPRSKSQLLSSPHLWRQNLRRLEVSHPRPLLLPPLPPLCW